jgi:hypothetical protein
MYKRTGAFREHLISSNLNSFVLLWQAQYIVRNEKFRRVFYAYAPLDIEAGKKTWSPAIGHHGRSRL